MEEMFTPERLLSLWNTIYAWIVANVFDVANIAQAVNVALTFVVASFLARRIRPWLARQPAHLAAARAAYALRELVLPTIWLVLLWLSISAATTLDRPYGLVRTVATLLAAWVAIRLVTQVVKNPAWAALVTWAAWTFAALSILGLLGPMIALLDAAAIEIGTLRISLYSVLRTVVVLAVLLSGALYLTGIIEARVRASRALSPTVQVLFAKSLKGALIAIALLIAIRSTGIDLTALAVLGGAIGLGVGFGFQKIVSNLISGVILLIDKSIKPGDVIAVSGTYGWVTTLGGRYISVRTRDGVEHLIPNETLISERVENWTHTQNQTRLKVDVAVHYRTDLHVAIAICEQAARETERVLKDPEPKALFVEFGDNALKLQLRFWIADAPNGVQNVKSAVLLRIWDEFKRQNIQMPYPREVRVVGDGAAGAGAALVASGG